MKFVDLVKLSTRMFKVRTSRTLLTVLGMGVGMATILFLVSLGFGVRDVVLEKMTTPESLTAINVNLPKDLKEDPTEKIKKIEGVEEVIPIYEYNGKAGIDGSSVDASFSLTDSEYLSMDGVEVKIGQDLNNNEARGAVVSSSFAKVLKKSKEELLGSSIRASLQISEGETDKLREEELEKRFKVIGVADLNGSEIYLNKAAVSSSVLEKVSLLKVRVRDVDRLESVKKDIENLGYNASSVSEIADQIRKFFSTVSVVLTFFGVIALFVSAVGMFNTMIVALLERTEEIGIMKSIGATDRNILQIFIFESTLMGILGGVAGVALGILLQKLFNLIVNVIAVNMGGEALDLFSTPAWFIVLLIGFAALVGFFTGLIPARRASSVDPLEALRRR